MQLFPFAVALQELSKTNLLKILEDSHQVRLLVHVKVLVPMGNTKFDTPKSG